MSTSSNLDRICVAALALAVLIAALAFCAPALGYEAASGGVVLGYEERLFDTSVVHTIDIVMDDWEGFIAGCEDEEYVLCDLVIDGEEQPGAGIRAKGNTSLSSVAAYGNDRYSFKIEFDHYDSSLSYYGLDKLNLNNIIQDNTYMKDFLSYQLMAAAGAAAPLCSYVWITVNGEDWGLYLAVEGVEESFLLRNYGTDYGELYKPDSMEMGGGRGNGGGFGGRGGMGGMPSDMGEPPEDMGGGLLSMLPWDYNLAFGGFMGSSDAEALVNWSIDDPTSDGDTESRPMLAWIFESEEYTELYHAAFAEFIESVFTSGEFERLFDETVELISPYVERGPTKFCTYEEFELGAETLREFCLLRAESIGYQLAGEDVTVDASGLDISAMGSMNNTAGGGGKGFRG